MSKKQKNTIEIKNRKASFNYEFIEEIISGIELIGSEVKSIRAGKASISEAYCYTQDGEVFITGMHIAEYNQAGRNGHDPYRKRKLLLTKKQIKNLDESTKTKGNTIVPIKLFLNDNGKIKLKIALSRGKKTHDKRNSIKDRDIKRDVEREIKG